MTKCNLFEPINIKTKVYNWVKDINLALYTSQCFQIKIGMGSLTSRWTKTSSLAKLVFSQSTIEPVFNNTTLKLVINHTFLESISNCTIQEHIHTNQEHNHTNEEFNHTNKESNHAYKEFNHANEEFNHANEEFNHAYEEFNQANEEFNHDNEEFNQASLELDQTNPEPVSNYTYLDPVSNYTDPEPLPHHANFSVFFYMCILMLVSNMATSTLRSYRKSLPFLRINQILLLNGYLVEVFNIFTTHLVILTNCLYSRAGHFLTLFKLLLSSLIKPYRVPEQSQCYSPH